MVATSRMEKLGDVIIHSNETDTFILATNPGLWVVAAFTPDVLGDRLPSPIMSFADMRAMNINMVAIERYRALNPDVYCEYQAIRRSAERHHVAPKHVFTLVHAHPAALKELISSHTMPEEIPQDALDSCQTCVMIDDVWPHTSYPEYTDWFHQTHPDFETTLLTRQ